MNRAISLRPICDADLGFLYDVYASTRAEELAVTGWDRATRENFLHMQFSAQHTYYQQHYAGASFDVILLDGQPAGRLYVARWPEEIRLMEIALLPAYRNCGIGIQLVQGLLAESVQSGRPVRLHVEPFNRALGLYQRLGFRPVADRGVYLFMEWTPVTVAQPVAS